MKLKYRLFCRKNGIYFCEDRHTGRQESLRTRDKAEAQRLLHARNESHENPLLNREIARAYLTTMDPSLAQRDWQYTVDELIKTKRGANQVRWQFAARQKPMQPILKLPLIETRAEHFLTVLNNGTVSTNIFLHRLHHFALASGWLLTPVLPPRLWPRVKYKVKRGITLEEHLRIMERERNAELHAYYQMLWEFGASQGDMARLEAEDIDWANRGISYARAKTGQPARVRFDEEVEKLLRSLPAQGPLFPILRLMGPEKRGRKFKQCCRKLGIEGVTLHSYRYAWAERARECGYPERLAQEALGHRSEAVHRAYAKGVNPEHLTIGEWKKRQAGPNVAPVDFKKPSTITAVAASGLEPSAHAS